MSYDSKLEDMLATPIVSSSSESLKYAEDTKQNQARHACKLPKNMRPNKEAFEALGFTFKDIGNEILYQASLPEGWKVESDDGFWITLIDEKGRKRGNYFCDGSGYMSLSQRFDVTYTAVDTEIGEGPFTVLIRDADNTIIFTAGKCAELFADEYENLIEKATEYLDSNYPDWKNPTRHWD